MISTYKDERDGGNVTKEVRKLCSDYQQITRNDNLILVGL